MLSVYWLPSCRDEFALTTRMGQEEDLLGCFPAVDMKFVRYKGTPGTGMCTTQLYLKASVHADCALQKGDILDALQLCFHTEFYMYLLCDLCNKV